MYSIWEAAGAPLKRRMRRSRGQGGVSLTEVLAATALLGALSGAAVLAVTSAQTRVDESMCALGERELRTAVESYRALTGYLPSNQGILVARSLLEEPSSMWIYQPPTDLSSGQAAFQPTPECVPG